MKPKNNLNDIAKMKNVIFQYILDDYGFRIGIVVAKESKFKGHYCIGWAMNSEVNYRKRELSHLRSIPLFQKLLYSIPYTKEYVDNRNSLMELGNLGIPTKFDPFDEVLPNVVYTPEDSEEKIQLMELALKRANPDSWNYYLPKEYSHEISLRDEDFVNKKLENNYNDNKETYNLIYSNLNNIKKTIKNIEYRAYRYFKDNF